MKYVLLILGLGLNLCCLSQLINPYAPIQPDSIYKQYHVKARNVRFESSIITQSNFSEYFNENGQIIERITYNLQGNEANYQAKYEYDNFGKITLIVSTDLTGKKGFLITPYSNHSNTITRKFEYNSSKLIRTWIIDSSGKNFSETIYKDTPKLEIYKEFDKNGNLRHEMKSFLDNDELVIKTEDRYYDDNGKVYVNRFTVFKGYEFDKSGRVIKSFNLIGKNKTTFKYHYNKDGLLKKVFLDNGYSLTSGIFSYEFSK